MRAADPARGALAADSAGGMRAADSAGRMLAADPALMSFAVHSLPSPASAARDAPRTRRGRWQMLGILAACAAPVIASYFAYFVVRPESRSNHGELVLPPRPLPARLALRDLRGAAVPARGLAGQWLLVVVSGGACDADCERLLVLQRQLHQALGASRDRVDKVWLIDDDRAPRPETLAAIGAGDAAAAATAIARPTVRHADGVALGEWLAAGPDGRIARTHLHVVDPRGDLMMRAPPDPDPARLKRDLDRLLRASASWDRPGRGP